jgi:pyruvate/2-oxoglutarate dehydrogenase complex dihydrolipoamide dehydrogenase (E3) component
MAAFLETFGHKVRVIDSMEQVKEFLDEVLSTRIPNVHD